MNINSSLATGEIMDKIPQKESPCGNRGRLPKLTAYEKIDY
jgi:hypothetical protein